MEGYRLACEIPVRFSDTDAMGHVNNAVYLSYLEEARVEYLRRVVGRPRVKDMGVIVARIEIDYKSPAFDHERLVVGCRVDKLGGSSISMSYRIEEKATGRLVAVAASVMVAFDYVRGRPRRLEQELRGKMEAFDGIS